MLTSEQIASTKAELKTWTKKITAREHRLVSIALNLVDTIEQLQRERDAARWVLSHPEPLDGLCPECGAKNQPHNFDGYNRLHCEGCDQIIPWVDCQAAANHRALAEREEREERER